MIPRDGFMIPRLPHVGPVGKKGDTMGAFQPMHLMLVALVVLLVFGPRKLPELARGVGESMKELKESLRGVSASEEAAVAREIGHTVQEIREAVNPLTPSAVSGIREAPPV